MMRFIADAMLGKLARWMRIMGCDTEYFSEITDSALSDRARRTHRTILTRDTRLVRQKINRDRAFFVNGDHCADQLRQVVGAFAIDPYKEMLTRCLRCNVRLMPYEKTDAAGKVPPYVFQTQDRFEICPECRKIYWKATHVERMAEQLDRMLKTNRTAASPAEPKQLEKRDAPQTI